MFLQSLTHLSLDSIMLYWHKILDPYHNILLLLCTLILPQPIFAFVLAHYPKLKIIKLFGKGNVSIITNCILSRLNTTIYLNN